MDQTIPRLSAVAAKAALRPVPDGRTNPFTLDKILVSWSCLVPEKIHFAAAAALV